METIPSLEQVATNSPSIPANNKYKLAFIIDGVVVTTVLTDARNAAIWTSSPTIVQIETNSDVSEGSLYDGSNFSTPESL